MRGVDSTSEVSLLQLVKKFLLLSKRIPASFLANNVSRSKGQGGLFLYLLIRMISVTKQTVLNKLVAQ